MPEGTGVALDAARENGRPPRDDLVRAVKAGGALRAITTPAVPADEAASENPNGMPTLYGYFTRYHEWTEIDSWYEGNFMEQVASGACKKTFRDLTPKVLFQHGMDGMVGDKPLGPPDVLREEADGPYYEVPLLDTTYVRDLIPGLEAGLYGASFRFSVMREEWVDEPGVSDHNPKGLPERTIKEMRVSEFGPVTFPAYPGATAAVRSMTDEWLAARMTSQPERLRSLLDYLAAREVRALPSDDGIPADTGVVEEAPGEQHDLEAQRAIEEAEATAPGTSPTPLYFGKQKSSRKATPGSSPTSLYVPKRNKRKGWVA